MEQNENALPNAATFKEGQHRPEAMRIANILYHGSGGKESYGL